MTTITMYDAIDVAQIPSGATAVAGYTAGRWPTFPELVRLFPQARHLSIAIDAAHDADVLDIETGDATPADAAGWCGRQKARGVARPCLYASADLMESDVVPAILASGISRAVVRLWSAHYTLEPHICGPASCGAMSTAADGTQWTDRATGRALDESLLAADFFAATPPPAQNWTDAMIANLPTLVQGNADKAGAVQYVRRMQALVKVIGDVNKLPAASAVAVTGTYDRTTWLGVLAIQKMFGLTQDGAIGPATWSALVAGQHG